MSVSLSLYIYISKRARLSSGGIMSHDKPLVLTMAAAPPVYPMPPSGFSERIPPAGCFSNAGQIGA